MTALHVSRNPSLQLTDDERRMIAPSIQQFQLGEGSRGERLLERGWRYARATNDPLFVGALDLFIREEQQHSAYLAAFMESQSIPLLKRHWVDTVFRKLRGLAGLELSLTVLVTAEIISVAYYRALRGATGSAILKMICTRILDDEASHLKFQASMLARIAAGRPSAVQRIVSATHRLFLLGTMSVVWLEHGRVFRAASYDFRRFGDETLREFAAWDACRAAAMCGSTVPKTARSKELERVGPRV